MYIFDLHCDTLHKFYENPSYNFYENNGCISNTHLRLGGYLAQCFAIYLPPEIKKEKQYMGKPILAVMLIQAKLKK